MVTVEQAHRWVHRYGGQRAAARALGVSVTSVRHWLGIAWYQQHPERGSEQKARWRRERRLDPEYYARERAQERKRRRERYATDPDFRLRKAQHETLRNARNRIAELENRAKELYR